jgi:ribose 5-phosphate isomerase
MVFIIEESKFVGQLKDAVPVLIEQEDWLEVAEEIDDLFLGDAEVDPAPVIDSGSILNLTNGNDCCPSHNSHVH